MYKILLTVRKGLIENVCFTVDPKVENPLGAMEIHIKDWDNFSIGESAFEGYAARYVRPEIFERRSGFTSEY